MEEKELLRKALNFFKNGKGTREMIANSLLVIQDEVLNIVPSRFEEERDAVNKVLCDLDVYGNRRVDLILETGTPINILALTALTARELANGVLSLPEGKQYKLSWGENTNKVIASAKEMFPEWFGNIEETLILQNLKAEFEREISSSLEQVQKLGAASIMTDADVTTLNDQITVRMDKIKAEILSSELSMSAKEQFKQCISEAYEQALAHVQQKREEEPIRLLYYKTGNRIAVKLTWVNSSWSYHKGRGKEVRINKGADRGVYKFIVSLNYIEDFLYINEVSIDDVWVEESSIQECYRFNDKISANLTPAFVREWYNYDAPTLERISPNIGKRGQTMFGMRLNHFTTNLIEDWKYVSEDITPEEAESLMKGFEHTGISKEIRNTLKARELKMRGEIDEIKAWVERYDTNVQNVIKQNEQIIINSLKIAFYDRLIPVNGADGNTGPKFNDNFGLDCGFINIHVTDPEYMEKRSILRNAISTVSCYMDLKLPVFSQSLTFMRKQFEITRTIVKEKLGIDLVASTMLD